MDHQLAALILTYNDSELTEKLCAHLLAQGEANYIVVVDNSDDKTIQATNDRSIPGISPKITYIKSPVNDGYAAGNNIGINYILNNTDAEYIWIINNDIIPQEHAASAMIHELQAYNNKAICGSVLLYYTGADVPTDSTTLQCFGGGVYYKILGKSKLKFKNLPLKSLYNQQQKNADYIMGASMMVHKSIFTEIGLLPEEYFMYFEELDWQTLAKKHGYKIIVAESSLVFHLDSLSTKNKRENFYYYLNRGAMIYAKKYYKALIPGILFYRVIEAITLVHGKKNKLYSLKGLYKGLFF